MANAIASLSRCTDLVAEAGCAPAAAYVSGAQGNIRRAWAELTHRNPHLGAHANADFDVERVGSSEVISVAGYPDTIRRCGLESGGAADVRALVQELRAERCVWMRPTGELENVQVRGRVVRTAEGFVFLDEPELEAGMHQPSKADLGKDIVASGLDLSARPTFAAALEVALTMASWVHLGSAARWYADAASARAVVRLAGGTPNVDPRLLSRLGVCVDRGVLRFVETLGWRHWPTPSVLVDQAT
ncbi:hypothetical protein [Sphingomonas sp. UYP23]